MSNSNKNRGLVHVYTGDGKGKTTAALGIALRAIGWGARVCIIQFIKGYSEIGEVKFAHEFPDRLTLKQFAMDTSRGIDEAKVTKRRKEAEAAIEYAEQVVSSGDYDVVILDEINNAVHYGLIDTQRLLSLISNRPDNLELILTGRSASKEIIDAADYVTEMSLIKHPYQQGIPARKLIDY
ncbi:MAG: cob(I)yrinic acid a,c-diamide adenosyltransferase [Armatimonadota bacterium]|nr:cob(I)yrinic acid a,c-diamide adenosyltransferase [bacterium]